MSAGGRVPSCKGSAAEGSFASEWHIEKWNSPVTVTECRRVPNEIHVR